MKRKTLILLRWIAPLAIFALLFVSIDISALISQLRNLTGQMLAALLGISFVLVYVSAFRWGIFVEELGSRISVLRLTSLYLMGYFINLILPSYVGGDAVRSWKVGKIVGQHNAFAATILERYTGIVAMVLLALAAMNFTSLATPPMKYAVGIFAVAVVLITYLATSPSTTKILSKIPFANLLSKHLVKLQGGFIEIRKNPKLLLYGIFLSFLYHGLAVLNTLFCSWAVGWLNVPVTDLCVVLPLILLIGAIPISPNGLGIQDGAFFYFLQSIGATPEQALGVALILRAKTYVLAIIGGFVWLIDKKGNT